VAWPDTILPQWPYQAVLTLGDLLPEQWEVIMANARERFGPEVERMQEPDVEVPILFERVRYRTAEEARASLRPFEGLATFEVRYAPVPDHHPGQLPLTYWQSRGPLVRPKPVEASLA
jgi:hypothetical protein